MNQVIGILGGMGPRATVQFEHMLLDRLPGGDQQLPTIISLNDGSIPDRSRFLLGSGASPVPRMQQNLRLLEQAGATVVCIPCNTACAPRIFSRLRPTSSRLINLPQEVAAYIARKDLRTVCLLATEGTIRAGTYQDLCGRSGARCTVPDSAVANQVTQIILLVKNGRLTQARTLARKIRPAIDRMGCQAVLLGCTELPLVSDVLVPEGQETIDTLAVLADAVVRYTYEESKTPQPSQTEGEYYDTRPIYA